MTICPARHLRALLPRNCAPEMAEIWEVANVSMRILIRSRRTKNAATHDLTIRVADSLSCEMAGSEALLRPLKAGHESQQGSVLSCPLHGSGATQSAVLENRAQTRRSCDARKVSIMVLAKAFPTAEFLTMRTWPLSGCGRLRKARRIARIPATWEERSGDGSLLRARVCGPVSHIRPQMGFVRANPAALYLAVTANEGEPLISRTVDYSRAHAHAQSSKAI